MTDYRTNLTPLEDRVVTLAMGRVFRMLARPEKPGDAAEFKRCRDLVLDIMEGAVPHDDLAQYIREARDVA